MSKEYGIYNLDYPLVIKQLNTITHLLAFQIYEYQWK